MKILTVDDNPTHNEVIAQAISNNYDVRTSKTGKDALKIIQEFKPDLILLDISLPDLNGFEICKWIKSREEFKHIKIIFMSDFGNYQNKLKGYNMGIMDFLEKPILAQELKTKLELYEKVIINENKNLEEENIKMRDYFCKGKECWEKDFVFLIHDFRNILTGILRYGNLLNNELPKHPNLTKFMRFMRIIEKLVHQISMEKPKEKFKKTKFNLSEFLELEIENLKFHPLSQKVQLYKNLKKSMTIIGNPLSFQRCFQNIFQNALEAMIDSSKKELRIKSYLQNDKNVLSFEDTGCGILEKNLEHVMKPFFTTKVTSLEKNITGGTGLGLSSCSHLLQQHGGHLEIENLPEKGARISMIFPDP